MEGCDFCDIVKGREDYVFYEDDDLIAFLNNQPHTIGDCMIIPKKHIVYLFDLDNELYYKMFDAAKRLEPAIRKATNAKKIGMALVGFEVPHVHLHLIPLNGPNEMFDSRLFRKASHDELKEMQGRIIDEMKNINE